MAASYIYWNKTFSTVLLSVLKVTYNNQLDASSQPSFFSPFFIPLKSESS